MQKKIAFLTSGHSPFDDRIYYHFAETLKHYNPIIISSIIEIKTDSNPIKIDCFNGTTYPKTKKINSFEEKLFKYHPDIIVCSEPLPIFAAKKYKKQQKKNIIIIYDITEWYPSRKTTEELPLLKKTIKFITLWIFNKYASFFADAFIFGEYYKSLPYRRLFPFKKWEIITYYPNLEYVHYTNPKDISNQICLGYTGRISIEKGIDHFFEVVKLVQKNNPRLFVRVKVIGLFANEKDKFDYQRIIQGLDKLEIEFVEYLKFEDYIKALDDINIFFDLRKTDYENNRCLPIKLYYYAASGRPVIYSNLKAIRKDIEVKPFGYLVNPQNSETIALYIQQYLNSPALYLQHCLNARKIAETKYNWDRIANKLTDFIESLVEMTDKKC